ncbi:MAG: hypothetical protein RL199_2512, partial [Pseudomonadota bacterium]
MNAVAKTVVIGGALLAGGVYALNAHNLQVTKLDYDLQRSRLRAAYMERTSFAYALSDGGRWRDELASTTRWYEAELADLANRHPNQGPAAAGDEREGRDEAAEAVGDVYGRLKSARYTPFASSTSDGVRIDLLSLRRANVEGRSRLRLDAVVWGAPRHTTVTKADGKGTAAKVSLDFTLQKFGLEFLDAKKKLLGGGDGGPPALLVANPERFEPAFPPQAAVAVWYLDPMPNDAATAELSIGGEIRSPGGVPIPVTARHTLNVEGDWRVRDGEKFEGEERTMPEEELDRGA